VVVIGYGVADPALMAAFDVTLAEPDPSDTVAAGEATRDASSAAVAIV
jgi:hypothetical protein